MNPWVAVIGAAVVVAVAYETNPRVGAPLLVLVVLAMLVNNNIL